MSDPAAEAAAIRACGGVADLSDRAKFRLTGVDRVRYLNGQVTNNIARLGTDASMPVCVTTAKGRLSGDAFVSSIGPALIIDAAPELREMLALRLERYIIADDVTLEDVTEELCLLHLLPFRGAAPSSLLRDASGGATSRTACRFGQEGLDLIFPATERPEMIAAVTATHPMVSPDLLEGFRVEAGVPRWGAELAEDTLPPEAGLDRTHIDYHKGCYVGQEVISRLKSVGHVNRHLTGFVSLTGEPLAAGLQLYAAGGSGKPLGHLTSAVWSFALSKPIALGYLKHGSPAEELLARAATGGGARVPVAACPLPFVT